MARIFTSGFESNNTTANVEWTEITNGTIQTGTVRSGAYAGQITSLVSGVKRGFLYQFTSSASISPFFYRVYVNFATLPTAENTFIQLGTTNTLSTATVLAKVTIDNTGVLKLYESTTQIGSASAALNTNQWYCIEIWADFSLGIGNCILKARIDQAAEFASSTTLSSPGGVISLIVGGNLKVETQTTGNWFFDDIAINDTTGSFQTSYPGSGKILHLKPLAQGDVNTFATQTGGTAGSANNYTRVNEISTDGATTLNGSNTLNEEDLFNCDDSGIQSYDTVNVVAVGFRYRNNIADAATAIKLEIEKAASSTIAQSAAIIRNATAFVTNANAAPRTSPLILYQDPDGANWTQSTLDSMQIGYKITTGGTNRTEVSTLWASVDYTPGVAPTTISIRTLTLLGVGV